MQLCGGQRVTVRANDPVLAGRDEDVDFLVAALRSCRGVAIVGEVGVGRSRLAREVLTRATPGRSGAADHLLVTATRAARRVPLGALAPWLPVPDPGDPSVTAVRRATDVLAERGARVPLGIDDAHLLDEVSAAVLHQLAERPGVRMVVTVRAGEPAPDAVTALWKDGLARRWELGPLTGGATRALAESLLGGPVDDDTARRLVATTNGNALWLTHLLDGERTAERLSPGRDGTWHWAGRVEPTGALEQLVRERIGVLSDDQREGLELLALGEPLGQDLMHRLVTPAVLEELADRGLVCWESDGTRRQLRVGHPLYGEVVRAGLGALRARRLRGLLSEAIAATGERRASDRLRRAVLDLDSDRRGTPALLTEAAGRSLALGDVDLAHRLFLAARDAGGGFEAQLGLGSTLMWRLHPEDAERELARATEEACGPVQEARALRARIHNAYLGRADTIAASARLDADLAGAASPHPDLLATRVMLDALDGRAVQSAPTARSVVASPEATWAARTLAGWVLVTARALQGHGDPVTPLAADAIAASRHTTDCAPMRAAVAFWEIAGLGLEGRPAAARDVLRRLGEEQGDYSALFMTVSEIRIALDAGRVSEARALVDRVRPHFPGYSHGWGAQLGLMGAAATAMSGDAAGAATEMDRARTQVHPGVGLLETQLDWAHAWVVAARGALTEAVDVTRRAAERAAARGETALEMALRHTAVCFGDRTQTAALARLATILDGPRAAAAAAHARAWGDRDGDALLAVADAFEAHDLLLLAADAAAQAATVRRDAGAPGPAAAAADRARALAERCGGARTPALDDAFTTAALSEREREIANVAAEGLTNRQVAERLGVSVRTVESHVYHARTRLGLADRAELIALVAGGRA